MPDALEVSDLKVGFSPGDRVLLRDQPLLQPMVVDHVTGAGRLVCAAHNEPPRRYQQWELVACPDGYESAPSSVEPLRAASWVHCNWALLVSLHGPETVALTSRHIHERIRMDARIAAALAEEPGASAIRCAEIAMGEVWR